jgi:hypothetical protein
MIYKIATVAAIVATLGLGSQAALAAPTSAHTASAATAAAPTASQEKAWVAQQVRGLLKANPGATQISSDAVRYKGAIIGVTPTEQSSSATTGSATTGSATPNSESGICPANYVCLFTNSDFQFGLLGEDWIDFYTCGDFYNLNDYSWVYNEFGDTHTFADVTSSIDYPGTSIQHFATFSHNGDSWLKLQRGHYLADLTKNPGPNPQGNSNDWITGLYAC